jgi:glycosyltransferase involved in cell wall biosynthesis
MESQQPIDIVITTWDREWMTLLCLDALKQNTQTPYRLIIIDNGSVVNAQEVYNSLADVYVKLDKNHGLEYAKNLGMEFVESPLFVSMDNDILVYKYEDKDWLARLIELMNNNPNYAAIAPKPQVLVGTGMYMFETTDEIVPFHHVPGYARIMRTESVRRAGSWNEKREGRGHEELWIGDKFAEMGTKMGWANNIKVWHLFGKEDTDEWGYPKGSTPESHGHNPVWPMPKNDLEEIERGVGIKI